MIRKFWCQSFCSACPACAK